MKLLFEQWENFTYTIGPCGISAALTQAFNHPIIPQPADCTAAEAARRHRQACRELCVAPGAQPRSCTRDTLSVQPLSMCRVCKTEHVSRVCWKSSWVHSNTKGVSRCSHGLKDFGLLGCFNNTAIGVIQPLTKGPSNNKVYARRCQPAEGGPPDELGPGVGSLDVQ